ncbi:MAG TPA: hypothetical protein VJC18_04055, partial [bacterium]|nr:hypothetical protein [bacterium]
PAAGVFRSHQQIGNLVQSGDVLGEVAGQPITAKIAGVLRGLIMPGIEVSAEQKLGDIDPRGDVSYSRTISDKARTISGSVLEVVVSYENSCLIQNSQNGKNV